MTIHIDFSPELEAKLKERAQAAGKGVERFVREAVEEKLASGTAQPAEQLTPQERLKLFREWVASHPVREGVHMDDSRESIYAGRGE